MTCFKLKRSFDVATEILRSRYRNKLNTDKQGRNGIFHLATKILTQGREVLSRHNKAKSRHKDELKEKGVST